MTRPVTLSEPHFSQHTLNKYASLMAQGNGYLGLRASHEEDYTRQTRGMYLAGLYHRAGKGEINELVNLPDVVGMEIAINGEVFSLSHEAWQRELDFASGELRRNVVWRTSNGSGYTIASRRFVSADQLPLIALEITIRGARRIRKKSYAKVFRASVRAETSRLPVCGSAARRNRRLG